MENGSPTLCEEARRMLSLCLCVPRAGFQQLGRGFSVGMMSCQKIRLCWCMRCWEGTANGLGWAVRDDVGGVPRTQLHHPPKPRGRGATRRELLASPTVAASKAPSHH